MAPAPSREDGTHRWSSRSIGSRFQHGVFYLLIRLKARWVVSALLRAVVCYYILFRPSVRNRGSSYLSIRFPGLSLAGRLKATYRLDLSLGEVLIDRAALGIIGPEAMRVDFPQREDLRALVREGKGLVLVTAHVGGWQAAMAALKFLEAPVNLLVHRGEGDVDLQFFEHGQGGSPFRIIDPAEPMGGMLTMMEKLKKGEVLCVMGDRVFGSRRGAVSTRFLGGEVPIPFGAFKVASVTGSPVAVLFSHRIGPGAYALTLDRVMRIPGGLGRSGADFAPYAEAFVEGLEAFTGAHPYQFFNFFDMWETSDASADRHSK